MRCSKYWRMRCVANVYSQGSDLDSYITDGRILEPPWKGATKWSNYTFYTGWCKWWCQTLVANEDAEGWAAELRCYLKDMPAKVTKDTDIIKWWQVSCLFILDPNHSLIGCSHAESLSAISNTGSYCTWCTPMSSLISSMWMSILLIQADSWWSMFPFGVQTIQGTSTDEVLMKK